MTDDPTPELMADLALGLGDRAAAAVNRRLRPSPLDLVFDRKLSGCVHVGQIFHAQTGVPLKGEWLRVGVTNGGSAAVEEVRVQALSLTPDRLGVLPAQLHRMHDNPGPGQPYEQSTRVPASKTPIVFADVVAHLTGAPVFELKHTVSGVSAFFPVGDYELELVVTGDGVKPRHRTFQLGVDRAGLLEFRRLR